MCDEAVDDFLVALTCILDWFVTNKMIEKPFTALYADDNIILVMLYFLVMKWVFLV